MESFANEIEFTEAATKKENNTNYNKCYLEQIKQLIRGYQQ